jgi:hypothetical protein
MKGDKGDTGAAGLAGSGALRVVDAGGAEVGMLAPPNNVIREIDGTWVQLALNSATEGFASCSTRPEPCPTLFFMDIGCLGPSYLTPASSLVQDAFVIDGEIRFRAGPGTSQAPRSFMDQSLECWELGGTLMDLAGTKSVPLSSLGLAAPFHVAR